jgi:uncharacterized protein
VNLVFLGFVVSALVTLTGVGGGSLMTPALILVGMSPLEAVRLDLLYVSIVKAFAAIVYGRRKEISWPTVGTLLCGGLPASLAGAWILHRSTSLLGTARINHVLTVLIAVVIIGAVLAHLRGFHRAPMRRWSPAGVIALGALVGFLVQFTSIGSGVIVLPILLALLPPREAVGTDIFYGFIIALVNGLLHLRLGPPPQGALIFLLAGSVPGAWVATRFGQDIPVGTLRLTLLTVLTLVVGFLIYRAVAA